MFGERLKGDGRYKKLLGVFAFGARQRKKYGIYVAGFIKDRQQAAAGI